MNAALLTYLCIGALIMVIAVLRTPYSGEPDAMVKALASGVSLFDRILAAFIAPLIGCLFTLVAWPVLVVWKLQDIRSTKGRLAIESAPTQPTYVRQGNPLIHAKINGKLVTAEEWDAARTQASGLPDSVAKAIAANAIEKANRKPPT